jgi:hypothetical protein
MGILLLASSAYSQAIGASAKTSTAPSVTQGQIQAMQSQIQMMQGQVQALVARVKSLEDQALLPSGSPEDAKQSKAIEQRLESIEHEQAKLDAKESAHDEEKGGSKSDRPEGLTVVAPFTVVDEGGKIIIRVAESGDGFSRGIYASDEAGHAVAHMGSTEHGGRFYAMSPESKKPELIMAVGSIGPVILGSQAGKDEFLLEKETLSFYDDSGKEQLSRFGTKNRTKGFLTLNENGQMMVEAGVLNDHKGYVLAAPEETSMDPHGDPSVLKGGRKKPGTYNGSQ